MDNGLIFPYPLVCANAESPDTNTTILPACSFGGAFGEGLVGLMG
jgi:hypothetical protein